MDEICCILTLMTLVKGDGLQHDESHGVSMSNDLFYSPAVIGKFNDDFRLFKPVVRNAGMQNLACRDLLAINLHEPCALVRIVGVLQELNNDRFAINPVYPLPRTWWAFLIALIPLKSSIFQLPLQLSVSTFSSE